MTDFQFKPIEQMEGQPPLIIGLSGMSDSGKTYSALLMAKSLAAMTGGKVCAIDSEGRMAKYSDASVYPELHPFHAVRITAPFDGDRYIAACEAAIKAGAGCIIADSASDEWEGEGGVLQSQEEHLARMAGDDWGKRERMNMAAWAKAKTPHQRWHAYLLGLSVPIILCHRARPKIKMVRSGGKTQIVDAGIQPICDSRLVYDMMFHLLMDEEKRDGSYTVLKGGYKHERHVFPDRGRIDAEAIKRLTAVNTVDKSKQPESAKAEATEPKWRLAGDGSNRYECVQGDPESSDAKKALYEMLAHDFKQNRTEIMLKHALDVFEANMDLISTFPKKAQNNLTKTLEDARKEAEQQDSSDDDWEDVGT